MDNIFCEEEEQKLKVTIFFVLFCSVLMCHCLGVIQFVELVSVDSKDEDDERGRRRQGRRRRQRE